MAMPSLFLLIILISSTLHACEARRSRFFESSRIEPCLVSLGFQMDHQLKRSFDENNSDKISPMEIVGVELLKGMKKHRKRLVMEFPLKDKVLKSEENEVGEDMVVMDYAQPHRKPPIHNEKH